MTTSMLGMPISTGFWTGPRACSSKDGARPSQNWAALNTLLNAGGACRFPFFPPTPLENWLGSANPFSGMWQEAQEIELSCERFFSKKSRLPRRTFSSVSGLSGGITMLSRASPSGSFSSYGAGALGASFLGASSSLLAQLVTVKTNTHKTKTRCIDADRTSLYISAYLLRKMNDRILL